MNILQLISTKNYITLNKDLIKLLGIEEAIILGELASEYEYWENKNQLEEEYFYSTIENIENNTTLSEHKQRKALNNLKEKGIIDLKIKGMPAKRYIKINQDNVLKLFNSQFLKILGTSSEKNEEQDIKNFRTNKNNIINNNSNNNIYNNNIINNIQKEEINKEEKDIFSYIEENYGRTLSPIEYEEIMTWEDNELTRYAIKQSILMGVYNIKYIATILQNFEKQSIKTVQQAQEIEKKFREKNNKVMSASEKRQEMYKRLEEKYKDDN